MRLNMAKTRLTIAKVSRNVKNKPDIYGLKIWFTNAVSSRRRILDTGPAKDVRAIPSLSLSKFLGLIGTGLLHPNLKIIIDIAPIGSMCAKGFSVSLPCAFGVGSPSFTAVIA